jgi:uncharacterized membrane protein YqaE (UPF0057 family)
MRTILQRNRFGVHAKPRYIGDYINLGGRNLSMEIIRIILAFFIPPLAVLLKVGLTLHFWLNLLIVIFTAGFGILTFGIGWGVVIIAVIHALWVLIKK